MIEHSTGTVNDPVTRHIAAIDADLHAGNPGMLLRDAAGAWEGELAIDTTELDDGLHRLMLRAECENAAGSTNAGVLVVPFEVDNN